MTDFELRVALISEVFFGEGARERLLALLAAVKAKGAQLAVLPELPLQPWCPATRVMREADAEPPGGTRAAQLEEAARTIGIGVLGGVIVKEGRARRNRALLFDSQGNLRGGYDKLHIPQEPGFFERDHYGQGEAYPDPFLGFGIPIGVQICSDINRPQGAHVLAARGAGLIIVPRATEPDYFARWRLVFQAVALTNAVYVLSVNRPRPEGAPLGGPSIGVAPSGKVIAEQTETMTIVDLSTEVLKKARADYPGYLDVRSELYAAGFSRRP